MISDVKLFETIKWSPYGYWDENGIFIEKRHEFQIKILECFNSGAKKIVVDAGVRSGKTAIGSYLVLKTFLQGLEDIKGGKKNSVKIWIVAPNYDLTQRVFDYVVRWILKVEPKIVSHIKDRPFPQILINNNIWIQCRSAENKDSLMGEELDLCLMDEASKTQRDIYETYIFARLASRQGTFIPISSPFGQNWFYQQWQQAKETNSAFQFRTIDNPYFPPEKWEEAKRVLPKQVFNQEYEASFLPDAAAVFRGIDEIVKDNAECDVIAGHRYVMGVDLGKHEDFTVLTVIDKWNNNVVFWDRFKDIEYPFQKARIKATALRYNNARIIVDSTGVGEPIQEDLAREGLFVDDFKFTNQSKKELVEKLSIFIEQKNVWIPSREVLIDELKSFGYQLTDAGNIVYKAPQGLHDDATFSLALAIWGLTGRANPQTAIQQELAKIKRHKKKDNFV